MSFKASSVVEPRTSPDQTSLKDPRPSSALQRIRSPATETSVPAAHFAAGAVASAAPGGGSGAPSSLLALKEGTMRPQGLEGDRPGGNSFGGDTTGLRLPTATGSGEGPLAEQLLLQPATLSAACLGTSSAAGADAGTAATGMTDCLINKGVGV